MRERTIGAVRRHAIRAVGVRMAAALLAGLALSACATDAALGPRGEHATMRIASGGAAAIAIGQTVVLGAELIDASGDRMRDERIVWDLASSGVLEPLGSGRFLVLKEGSVQVAAIWPKDPSVRATVTVTVDAGLLAMACIIKSDQASSTAAKCAQKRVVVRVAPSAV